MPEAGTLYQTAVTSFCAAVVICQVADALICRTRRQSILSAGIEELLLRVEKAMR